jgi:hypothetical protein
MKTVGIGSLPHKSIKDAVAFSLKHDLAFLPQMTSLGERMIPQTLSSRPLIEKYSALSFFTEKILENKISNFKIQIAGPETCRVEAHSILYEIDQFLKYFDKYNLTPIIFIDEPVFISQVYHLDKIFKELARQKIISGLHSCARLDWELVEKLEFNYLSFDIKIMFPLSQSQKILIAGIPPFTSKKYEFSGEWVSSSCGLAMFSEIESEKILENLKMY